MGAQATAIDAPGPVQPGRRIEAIDALRGFALCGILLVNILAMGGSLEADYPSSPPNLADPDWQVFWAGVLFVEGAMRGLFSILFGAGMLLFLREAGAGTAAGRGRTVLFMRRAGWLAVFGVINCTILLWPGDVLLVYAFAAFAILPFARRSPRTLLTIAGVLVVVLAVWSAAQAIGGGPPTPVSLAHVQAALADERAARLGGYLDNLVFMSRKSWEWTWTPDFLWWIVDGVSAMLIGMALLKLRVLTGEASRRTYALMAAAGFAIALPLGLAEGWLTVTHLGDEQPLARALLQPRRIALAFGWLGLFMLLWRAGALRFVARPLAALGRMALTGYLSQSVLAAFIFSGFGLGLWGAFGFAGNWAVAAAIWAVEAVFCMLWLARYRFGPMEWLWRWLTYGSRPRLRI
jgi:uncharacterized protein